jgi:Rps23 Pro-64 3,4-dihydroxylase Tpa1-like proline 4-hydroxylase
MPEEIIDILEKVFKIAYQKCTDFYNVKLRLFEKKEVHLIKFEKGYKMYQHVDTLSNDRLHFAAIYYINDDYEGGEINFTSHNLNFKPKANSLIMFPGNEGYPHEVLETIGKERYSSTLWFEFEE